jgi:hypothetical protein
MILALIIAVIVVGLLLGWFNSQALLTFLMLLPIALAAVGMGIMVVAFPREAYAGATDVVALISQYAPVVVAWAWYPAIALVAMSTIAALVSSLRDRGPARQHGVLATIFAGLTVTLMMVQMTSLVPGPDASVLVSAMLGLISIAVLLQGPVLVTFVRTMTLAVIARGQPPPVA